MTETGRCCERRPWGTDHGGPTAVAPPSVATSSSKESQHDAPFFHERKEVAGLAAVFGEYDSVLQFRNRDDPETHSVDFTFRISDRSELEVPRRRGGATP